MEVEEARILLGNLIRRIEKADGGYRLDGRLTEGEVCALEVGLAGLGQRFETLEARPLVAAQPPAAAGIGTVEVDRTALDADIPKGVRFCLDFGTAMSKATLVDDTEGEERIHVLPLGSVVDQSKHEYLLLSSVYVSDDGALLFGEAAEVRSHEEGLDGSRQRLDNIKRRMSEEGWNDNVSAEYNPTDLTVTYGDMVLAYLTYLTWVANECLRKLGYGVLTRRFALPAFEGAKQREVDALLKKAIGRAQLLADTFGSELVRGVPLCRFMAGVRELEDGQQFRFVGQSLTEPAGVAGSMLSWRDVQQSLVLVVDIGAGTSDIGLYRLYASPTTGSGQFLEVEGSTRTLTQAGNYLDRVLMEHLVKTAGVLDSSRERALRNRLSLRIRDYKESLFSDGEVSVFEDDLEASVAYDEFVELPQVKRFTESLGEAMTGVLEAVDESWLDWVRAHPGRALAVMLTGGCAGLPFVRDLAGRTLVINERPVRTAAAQRRPVWLDELSLPAEAEVEYGRIAVSLGGARQRLMTERVSKLTAA